MSRSRHLAVLTIALDRGSSLPLHEQVRHQIARAIRSGALDGTRLPSTRVLARLLGVSRNTVMAAYDDLVADGLIRGRRGAGMLVGIGAPGMPALDPRHVLMEAQYPVRTLHLVDPDGAPVYLSFR